MTGPRKTSRQKKDLTEKARMVGGSCVAFAARGLARKITQTYERHLEASGLTLPQFSLLNTVAAAEDDTLGALAQLVGLDPSTMTRNLQGLEKLGLVEIATVEKDMRRRAVWLTEAWARKLAAAMPAWDAAQAEVLGKLGADMRSQLRRAAKALA
jgi:DNA-binding MarR family transcriptional regulator